MYRPYPLLKVIFILFFAQTLQGAQTGLAVNASEPLSFAKPFEEKIENSTLSLSEKLKILKNLKTEAGSQEMPDDEVAVREILGFQTYLEMYLEPDKLNPGGCKGVQAALVAGVGEQENTCLKDFSSEVREVFRVLDGFCPELKKTKIQNCVSEK